MADAIQLPFLTSPEEFETFIIGNPKIGELKLPKYGDLTPNERIFIKNSGLADIRMEAVKLANSIAAKSGKTTIDIYDALTLGNSQFLSDFLEDFVNFQDIMEENSRLRKFVLATAIIQRITPNWSIENTQDINQIRLSLVKAVAEFAAKEEAGWSEETIKKTTEEDLGNLPNQEIEIPTGEKSTGDVAATGHKKKDSAPKTSETSQPG